MKQLILTSLLVFTVGLVFAQVKVGPKVGLNYAYMSNEDAFLFFDEPIIAYHFGAAAEFSTSERFAFIADVLLTLKGAKSSNAFFGETHFQNQYVALPIGVKFKQKALGLSCGFEMATLIQERVRIGDGSWGKGVGVFEDLDVGLFAGFDYAFGNMLAGVRYVHGINNASEIVFTDANGQALGTENSSNRVLQFSVTYLFGK